MLQLVREVFWHQAHPLAFQLVVTMSSAFQERLSKTRNVELKVQMQTVLRVTAYVYSWLSQCTVRKTIEEMDIQNVSYLQDPPLQKKFQSVLDHWVKKCQKKQYIYHKTCANDQLFNTVHWIILLSFLSFILILNINPFILQNAFWPYYILINFSTFCPPFAWHGKPLSAKQIF